MEICSRLVKGDKYACLKARQNPYVDQSLAMGNEGELLEDASLHQRLVGRLIYLIIREKISYVVEVVSKFMHSSCAPHFEVALELS